MRRERVRDLLGRVADGSVPVDAALASLAQEPTESLGFATIDHDRALRQGFPEVVYGAGKTTEQLVAIAKEMNAREFGARVQRVTDAIDCAKALRDSSIFMVLPPSRFQDRARGGPKGA